MLVGRNGVKQHCQRCLFWSRGDVGCNGNARTMLSPARAACLPLCLGEPRSSQQPNPTGEVRHPLTWYPTSLPTGRVERCSACVKGSAAVPAASGAEPTRGCSSAPCQQHTIYCQSSRVHPPLQRLRVCVCVCVCECVSDPTAGQNGSAPEEPLLVPMLVGRHLQCPEGSELDSQVLQHCCARTLPWQQSKGGGTQPTPPHGQSRSFLLN